MPRRSRTARKLRTRGHVLADLSANYVEKQAHLCGFTTERVRFDYGIDLIVQTFNGRGEVESSRILFQLKATDHVVLTAADAIACRVERADLNHWLEEPLPVVLVMYDAKKDIGYWLHIQQDAAAEIHGRLIGAPARQVLTVPIAHANVLDRKAMLRLARAKNKVAGNFRRSWSDAL